MSQAALPTKSARGVAPGGYDLRRLTRSPGMRLGLGLTSVAMPAVVVAIAVGPEGRASALQRMSHVHPHAPRLELLAQVWRLHPVVVLHMGCALAALVIGCVLMAGVKGSAAHRALGYLWSACMLVTAVSSFWIRTNHGALSFIHFLSGWTTLAVPIGVALARRHSVRRHGRLMTSVFVGGLLVAGLFTFLPGRLMFALFLG